MRRLHIQAHHTAPALATVAVTTDAAGRGSRVLDGIEALHPSTIRLGVVLACAGVWALVGYSIIQLL